MCPIDAATENPSGRKSRIVLALVGDSTITKARPSPPDWVARLARFGDVADDFFAIPSFIG
jgi:hypothetical protein